MNRSGRRVPRPPRIIFITGTDTGVGKTLLTALLLSHLRGHKCAALAMKPFCSGGRADAELLHALQDGDLTLDEINPFCFAEPVAPLVAACKHRLSLQFEEVVERIQAVASRLTVAKSKTSNQKSKSRSCLLIEGSGGLLVPLGEGYSVLDLIVRLRCETIIVSRNQLGTLNHTLLTVRALQNALLPDSTNPYHLPIKVALMAAPHPDPSSASNPLMLAELLAPIPLIRLPFLGPRCQSASAISACAVRLRSSLAALLKT
jgi:dethiobiotin synthetase